MLKDILSDKVGKKAILLGNEAIVRGALESGTQFASTYPGTPASEIGDTFSAIAKQAGIYFEYSTNEKVALEAAAGAALSGIRSIVSFKHYGLNVASDSIFPLAYTGVKAGMVIVFADDPGCWSSAQSEQDSRYFAFIAHLPMLEPSDAQECKDFVKLAFDLSEKFRIPVFVRTTTRVSHLQGIVKLGKIFNPNKEGKFIKDISLRNFPPMIMKTHEELHKKMDKIKEISEKSELNFIVNKNDKSKVGIITSGASFNYVIDGLDELEIKIPVLKLGITYPLPENKIKSFIKNLESVLIVEELEPVMEEKIRAIAKEINPKLKINGKDCLPVAGELSEAMVIAAIAKVTGKELPKILQKKIENAKIAKRLAVLCPGCPHRATFYAAKIAGGKDTVYAGDIGCYILGINPPLETVDFLFSMGASQGLSHGIRKVTNQKVIAFIGDSTFFHAGIPGLINMVYNKSNPLIIVLDNRITAMTGHQPHPGTGKTGIGEGTKEIRIEEVAKACGVENIKIVDPFNFNEMVQSIKEFLQKDKVSVIIARRECRLLAVKDMKAKGIKVPKFMIDKKLCKGCGTCLLNFGCPAIIKEGKSYRIDENLCTGCSVCSQVCPNKAIKASI